MSAEQGWYFTPASHGPLLGVLPELVRQRRRLHELFLRYATAARAVDKPFVKLSVGPLRRMDLVADPAVADEVLRSPSFADRTSFPIIDAIYAQFVGAAGIAANMGGITFVNAEAWRRNRVAALRCLSRPSFLLDVRRVTQACADRLTASWQARGLVGSKQPVDLGRELSRLAIDVMGLLCWKTDLGAIDGDLERFVQPVHTMLDAIQRYIYVPLPAAVLARLPTPTLRRLRTAVQTLREQGDALLASRIDPAGRLAQPEADDVLAFLLHELVQDPMAPTRDELDNVQATLMDLLGAGHDTTANSMAFCLGLLAQPAQPTWQDRIAAEAQRPLGDSGDGRSAPLLTAAYRETLRLFPLGAMFSRVASADTTLPLGEKGSVVLPAGTQLFVSPYVLGRDPREWRDVEQFQPQRHLSTGEAGLGCPHLVKLRAPAYAPYGGGKRSCVGAQLAEVEAQAAIGRILRSLRLELVAQDAPIEADLLFTLRPRQPLWVRLEPRPAGPAPVPERRAQ